jgi:hypothetical protein
LGVAISMVTRPAKEVPAQANIAYGGYIYLVRSRTHLMDSTYQEKVVTVVFHVTAKESGRQLVLSVPADRPIRILNP